VKDLTRTYVWDLPTRLFHWTLIALVAINLYTGFDGGFEQMDYHMLSGYSILTLILFRIGWGFLGARYARFSNFMVGPTKLWRYLRSPFEPGVGHTPPGGLSIVALLAVLLFQTGTGLFANDDVFLEGPLTHLVSYGTSRQLTSLHGLNAWILCGLIGLHLAAIAVHEFYVRDSIVRPMVTGWKLLGANAESTTNRWITAACLLVAAMTTTWLIVNYL
jgi:cytochrome b